MKFKLLFALFLIILSGCSDSEVKPGDLVSVNYIGTFDDGEIFDQSDGKLLTFTVGDHEVIPGFENAVLGMGIGDKKDIKLQPEEAYGLLDSNLILEIPAKNIENRGESPLVGDIAHLETPDGRQMPATILEVNSDSIKVDANHPLAGKILNFNIELVEIK